MQSKFKKYQHINRIGTSNTDTILDGDVYVFPKLDGCNCCIWSSENKINAGSRNKEITADNDEVGFYKYANSQKFIEFFKDNSNLRLYGEWLIPHTIKRYEKDAWNKFYVFDVVSINENDEFIYLPYEEYSALLSKYNIEFIPLLKKLTKPTLSEITELLNENTYLLTEGIGEGVVIKRYDFVNKFGLKTWGKIVVEKHLAKIKSKIDSDSNIEETIIEKYFTTSLIEKEYAKLVVLNIEKKRLIPTLLSTLFKVFIDEECYNFVKKLNKPTINFKILNALMTIKIRETLPDLFT